MKTFFAFLAIVSAVLLILLGGAGEATYPIGLAQAGKVFLYGLTSGLLLYFSLIITGEEKSAEYDAHPFMLIAVIVGFVGVVIFLVTASFSAFYLINGTVQEVPSTLRIAIMLFPFTLVCVSTLVFSD